MKFQFDLKASRPRFSDQELLSDLQAFAATVGNRPFSSVEYESWPLRQHSVATITKRFRGWPAALDRIGIAGSRHGHYSAEEAMNRLETLWLRLGHPPGANQLRRWGNISLSPFERIWGGVPQACKQLARYHAGNITRTQLLAGIPEADRPPRRYRPTIKPGLRWSILERDHQRCTVCGRAANIHTGVSLEIDHITPVSKGGSDHPSNLRTLCKDCNRGKGSKLDKGAKP